MSDLINGREMLNRYQADLCYGIACKDCSMSTEDGGCKVEEWIDKFPSADRPQGEWICHEGGWKNFDYYPTKYECDQCHHYVDVASDKNFCPNCGADMRKGADDE